MHAVRKIVYTSRAVSFQFRKLYTLSWPWVLIPKIVYTSMALIFSSDNSEFSIPKIAYTSRAVCFQLRQ